MNSEAQTKLNNLDLSVVRDKFLKTKSFWWKLCNNIKTVEQEYKKFLYLSACELEKNVVVKPWNQNVLDFWKEHLIDEKYQATCQEIFGLNVPLNSNIEAEKPKNLFAKVVEHHAKAPSIRGVAVKTDRKIVKPLTIKTPKKWSWL